jgi:outer membrane protein assembly factor BamB
MKMQHSIGAALAIGMLLIGLQAADFPQWRGLRRDGIAQEKGLLRVWPKEGPKLLWQLTDVGEGYGAPAITCMGQIRMTDL